jgi:hypothetical protein
MSEAKSFAILRGGAASWSVAWAVSTGIVEYLTLAPRDDWGSGEQIAFWLLYRLPWFLVGLALIWLADFHERSHARIRLLAGFIAICAVDAILNPLMAIGMLGLTKAMFPHLNGRAAGLRTVEPTWNNWSGFSLYQLWETMFYGGLLVAARIFAVRVERTGDLLHQTAMARSRTEALLDDARLQALQSQIDPNLLLESMQELEQRYRTSPERAERLLEALVEFLRYAMHGLRVPVSTLDAELHLARVFSQLQQERGVGGVWRIAADSLPPSATQVKFPSLLILQLLALGGGERPAMLRVRSDSGRTILSLHGLSRSVPTELRQQMRARLYALYGERFQFDNQLPGPNQLKVTLPVSES